MRNNCEAYGKTQKCLNQNTKFVFCKKHLCIPKFSICGASLLNTILENTSFLKNEIGLSNIGDFEKIWNRAKTIFSVRVQHSLSLLITHNILCAGPRCLSIARPSL